MKKMLTLAIAACALASCNQTAKKNSPAAGMTQPTGEKGLIAYVEYDSLMSQYEYCKEFSEQLQQRSATYQQQLVSKQNALEKAAEDFQRKLQAGQFASQEEAQAQQQKLQNQQLQLQKLSAELEEKFAKEQQAINDALRDSVQNFMKDFNKDGRYSLIMAKVGDNLLYAQEKLDITEQVVSGLNKRYKKAQKD